MPNLHFAVLAAPDKHEQIMKDINSWKYEIEGEVAKGEVAPVIHELKFYEVRCPPEMEADFVRDMNLQSTFNKFGVARNLPMRILFWLYNLALFFSPYKKMDESKKSEPKKYTFQGTWHYAVPIGKLTRRKMKVRFGKDRDVL